MPAELLRVTEEFERLWEVAGFAEGLAARMARPSGTAAPADPTDMVLATHRRLLTAALRDAQQQGHVEPNACPDDLADAVLGVYLSRRLAGRSMDGWAREAIAVVALH
jgi:hypothetical protein